MSYIEGFVAAVPRANKDAYRKHATAYVFNSPDPSDCTVNTF